MGVGAIFIATLALTKLPSPNVPPETPDDFLVLNIQPIVYFLVLCSIIIHGSSIPFFNLGKRVHSFHRTMTNRSDSEPSWLSRVKRAGDGDGIIINRDGSEKEKSKNEKQNGNVDLEAGERVFDDAGMDIGDMSSKDYAGKAEKKRSPAGSEETVSGSYKGKEREGSPSDAESGSGSSRAEKHYREKDSNEQQVWQEGGETIIDSKDGEDTTILHRDGSRDERDFTGDAQNHHNGEQSASNASNGSGGFPDLSSRMAQIAAMIERGHHMSHQAHDKASAEDVAAKAAGKTSRDEEAASKRQLDEAAERIVREDSRAQQEGHAEHDHDEYEDDHVPPMQCEKDSAAGTTSGASPSRPSKMLSMESFINRPKHARKTTLTNEEKMARDAWCRRERRDLDDDEVRAWVSGKHIVIERNNGEDVEVLDANPSREARESARKNPDLKLRAIDQDRVSRAKKDIAEGEAASAEQESRGRARSGSASQGKRFDLKAIRNNQSFRKFFGAAEESPSPSPARSAEPSSGASRDSSPNRPGVTFAANTGDKPERSGAPVPPNAASGSASGSSSTPNFLSTRGKGSTGIPLERSETTDSQVRFGHLPKGKRK